MADLIFGLLALPQNIKNLIEIGKWICHRIDTFQDLPRYLQDNKRLALELYSGQLRLQLELVPPLLSRGRPVKEHCLLATQHIENLTELGNDACNEVKRCDDSLGNIRRLYFTLHGEGRVKMVLSKFRRALNDFQAFIVCLDLFKNSTQGLVEVHLTRDRFSVFDRYETGVLGSLTNDGYIRLAEGELQCASDLDMDPEELTVILEKQDITGNSHPEALDTVIELARMLRTSFSGTESPKSSIGIMECLGYRSNSSTDLVFRVPLEVSGGTITTLHDLISHNNHRNGMSTGMRCRLAYDISAVIRTVHSARLVHKNARPDSILVAMIDKRQPTSEDLEPQQLLKPFLSAWSLMRSCNSATTRSGTDDWTRNIYRHPERQGLHLDTRYTPAHDISSLGVTLLELGLWEPLVIWSNETPQLSSQYLESAARVGLGDTQAILVQPGNVMKIMQNLASEM